MGLSVVMMEFVVYKEEKHYDYPIRNSTSLVRAVKGLLT
jgi:hypothetical protein